MSSLVENRIEDVDMSADTGGLPDNSAVTLGSEDQDQEQSAEGKSGSSDHEPDTQSNSRQKANRQAHPPTCSAQEVARQMLFAMGGKKVMVQHLIDSLGGAEEVIKRINNLMHGGQADHRQKVRPHEWAMKYSLGPADLRIMQAMPEEEILKKFKDAPFPWNHVGGVVIHEKSRRLLLQLSMRRAEEATIAKEDKATSPDGEAASGPSVQTLFDLSPDCYIIWDRYLVLVTQQKGRIGDLEPSDELAAGWSKENGVRIKRAYRRSGKLILALAGLEDADELCKRTKSVFLSGRLVGVE